MNPTTDTQEMQDPQEGLSSEEQLLIAVLEQLQNKVADLDKRVSTLEGGQAPQNATHDTRFDALDKVANALKDITGKKKSKVSERLKARFAQPKE